MQGSNARQLEDVPVPRNRIRPKGPNIREKYSSKNSSRKKKKTNPYDRVLKGSKAMPSIFRRGNIYFLVENEASQYRIPKTLIITVALVFTCALVITLAQAQLVGMERQIARSNSAITTLTNSNTVLASQLTGRYTLEEIEEIATTQLGMIHPDSSQIIEIYVPPQCNVVLNRVEHLLPRENYFWTDIRTFVSGLFNRFFGGS